MADYPPTGLSASVQKLPEWIQLGCGDKEYMCAERGANFPGDECPAELPDLKEHNSVMADIIKKKPELYGQLKDKKNSNGSWFSKMY